MNDDELLLTDSSSKKDIYAPTHVSSTGLSPIQLVFSGGGGNDGSSGPEVHIKMMDKSGLLLGQSWFNAIDILKAMESKIK